MITRRKKIIIIILVLTLGGLWYFNLPYHIKCLKAKQELKQHFFENKENFYSIIPLLDKSFPIEFRIYSRDSIYMTFQDTSINYFTLFDSIYNINSDSKLEFLVNQSECLLVVYEVDTIEICNQEWQVNFEGHFKDKRIDNLIHYIGWTKLDFENAVMRMQELKCHSLAIQDGSFLLGFKTISYYNDGGLHCFGHSDGYFDYLYTTKPDSFQWRESLVKYHGNFYGIENW